MERHGHGLESRKRNGKSSGPSSGGNFPVNGAYACPRVLDLAPHLGPKISSRRLRGRSLRSSWRTMAGMWMSRNSGLMIVLTGALRARHRSGSRVSSTRSSPALKTRRAVASSLMPASSLTGVLPAASRRGFSGRTGTDDSYPLDNARDTADHGVPGINLKHQHVTAPAQQGRW